MNKWVRFEHNGNIHFGKMDDTQITHYQGDMFTENDASRQGPSHLMKLPY